MCRYGVMCKPDGMVFDDGVVMRVGEQRFVCTTTTGNAAPVLDWMEEWLQTEWPELRVWLTSVTEQWATVAVVGPDSRALLARLTEIPLDPRASRSWRSARAGRRDPGARLPHQLLGRARLRGERRRPPRARALGGDHGAARRRRTAPRRCTSCAPRRATRSSARTPTAPSRRRISAWTGSSRRRSPTSSASARSRAPTPSRPDRKQLVGLLPADRDELARGRPARRRAGDARRCSGTSRRATAAPRSAGRSRSRSSSSGRERIGETVYADGSRPSRRLGALRHGGSAPRWPSCVSSSSTPRSACAASRRPASRRAEHDGRVDGDGPLARPGRVARARRTRGRLPGRGGGRRRLGQPRRLRARRATTRPTCSRSGCSLDLHPSVFPPGRCAQTLLARAQVILYRPERARLRLLVRPSFADYLRAWLDGRDGVGEPAAGLCNCKTLTRDHLVGLALFNHRRLRAGPRRSPRAARRRRGRRRRPSRISRRDRAPRGPRARGRRRARA